MQKCSKTIAQPLSRLLTPLARNPKKVSELSSVELLTSHGYIRQVQSGIFDLLPLGLRVQQKIANIVRKHLNEAECTELELSTLVNPTLWRASGRLDPEKHNDEFTFTDGRKQLLAPTGEEQITTLVGSVSYRQLPLSLYQITRKFRNELRPRGGLLRTREFLMKDLYTFDTDSELASQSYQRIKTAYENIFNEIGIPYVVADADSGDMGGDLSHEYHYVDKSGEDTVVHCKTTGYTANLEKAISRPAPSNEHKSLEWNGHTVRIPAGRELSEPLVNNALKAGKPLVDWSIDPKGAPLVVPAPGDLSAHCDDKLEFLPCIEIGHTFYLGSRYSEPLKALVSPKDGAPRPIEMGCYGIGVTRIIGAVAEKQKDDFGLVWPKSIAPFQCVVVSKDVSASKLIADDLANAGIEVAFDDRTNQIGHAMRASRESGIPLTIVLGRSWEQERLMEILPRIGESTKVPRAELVQKVTELLKN